MTISESAVDGEHVGTVNAIICALPTSLLANTICIAWMTWMLLHLLFIMGMRNRIHVFVNWTAAYFNKNSSLRLIFKPYIRDDK